MDTPRAALTQAVLEGVAFAIRDCVEIARAQGVKIKASTLCGGGAKSPLWREILANVLGIPLTLPQTEQGPGYGGAMLAAVACGAYPSVQACAETLVHAKSNNPAGRRARRKIQRALRCVAQAVPGTESILCGNGGTAMKIFL